MALDVNSWAALRLSPAETLSGYSRANMVRDMPKPFSREPRALENRLRRWSYRQGLQLVRLPKPDPLIAPLADRFLLCWPATGQVLSPTLDGLDEVEAWLALDANARRKHMRKLVAAR